MEFDKIKWNEKHLAKRGHHLADGFLQAHIAELKKGKALDLACGRGRNAFFMAQNGFETLGVDYSDIGINITKIEAMKRGLSLQTLVADLDQPTFLLDEAPFSSIVCINFKPKTELLQLIPELLIEGGSFLLCSFNDLQALKTPFPLEKALQQDEFIQYWNTLETMIHQRFTDETGERDGYVFRKSSGAV